MKTKNKEKNAIKYKIFRFLINLWLKISYFPKIKNKDLIPKEGPIILCGNHINNIDPLLVCTSIKRIVHYMAKKELHDSKIGFFFRWAGTIPVDRSKKNNDSVDIAITMLNEGCCIGIFPEGTTNKKYETILLPFKYGAVSMASKTNAIIIPFSITGKYKIFGKSITICFEKGIKVNKNDDLEIANQKLYNIIESSILKNEPNYLENKRLGLKKK